MSPGSHRRAPLVPLTNDTFEAHGGTKMATPYFKMTRRKDWCAFLFVCAYVGTCNAGEGPRIGPIKIPEDLEEGQRLLIVCGILKGAQPIAFSWRKNSAPVLPSDDIKISHNEDYQETLQILKVGPNHVGNYTCHARNAFGSDQMSVQVILKFKPRWLNNPLSNASIIMEGLAGSSIMVDCRARGHPPPTISIKKGNYSTIEADF